LASVPFSEAKLILKNPRRPDLQPVEATDTVVTRMQVDGPRPALAGPEDEAAVVEGDEPMESWGRALEQLLQRWV
jgi:hypothetical protein